MSFKVTVIGAMPLFPRYYHYLGTYVVTACHAEQSFSLVTTVKTRI